MRSAVAVGLVVVLGTGVCQAQNLGTPLEAHFRLEWEVEQARSGRPTISGYIYNDHDFWATALQFRVEELDSSGRVVSQTIRHFDGFVPPGERRYFQVRVPTAEATYGLTVHSVDWFGVSAP
ncbi:MAG: hypothetical protein ACE5FK_05110 [Candidatus Methylomirabilia bacterium]